MKSFILVLALVLAAVGIGVAVESSPTTPSSFTSHSAIFKSFPPTLRSAVDRTMAASSLEATENGEWLVYNAPDRLSISAGGSAGRGVRGTVDELIVGDTSYFADPLTPTRFEVDVIPDKSVLAARSYGLTPASAELFTPLLLLSGAGAVRADGSRYDVASGRNERRDGKSFQILGGTIDLQNGYVSSLRLLERTGATLQGKFVQLKATLFESFNHVDAAPAVAVPSRSDLEPDCRYGYEIGPSGTATCSPPPIASALSPGWSPASVSGPAERVMAIYAPVEKASIGILRRTAQLMQARLRSLAVLGSARPEDDEIVLEIPKVKRKAATTVLDIVSATAALTFRPVLAGAPPYGAKQSPGGKAASYRVPPSPSGRYRYSVADWTGGTGANGDFSPPSRYQIDPIYSGFETTTPEEDFADSTKNVILPQGPGEALRYVLGPAVANGTIIKSADTDEDQTGQWLVYFELTSSGSMEFDAMAAKYYHQLVANDLDGTVVSAPSIDAQRFNGSGQISGNFTASSARGLAVELSDGALPVRLRQLSIETASPAGQ